MQRAILHPTTRALVSARSPFRHRSAADRFTIGLPTPPRRCAAGLQFADWSLNVFSGREQSSDDIKRATLVTAGEDLGDLRVAQQGDRLERELAGSVESLPQSRRLTR